MNNKAILPNPDSAGINYNRQPLGNKGLQWRPRTRRRNLEPTGCTVDTLLRSRDVGWRRLRFVLAGNVYSRPIQQGFFRLMMMAFLLKGVGVIKVQPRNRFAKTYSHAYSKYAS